MNIRSIGEKITLSDYPKIIIIRSAPPNQEGESMQVSPEEFAKALNFEWSESISLDKKTVKAKNLGIFNDYNKPLPKEIMQEVVDTSNKLLLVYTNGVGWGVFATDTIPEGTYVSFYAGDLKNRTKNLGNHYAFAIANEGDLDGAVTAEKKGNISRFFQHLPDALSNGLNSYRFKYNVDIDSIATANLAYEIFTQDGVPIVFFKASAPIYNGDQLGFDYKYNWSPKEPFIFYKDGNIVDPQNYLYRNEESINELPEKTSYTFFSLFKEGILKNRKQTNEEVQSEKYNSHY